MASAPGWNVTVWLVPVSAAYGQGWDMDAIAACVVGGVSFTGGIGKISGVVIGCTDLYLPDLLPDDSGY